MVKDIKETRDLKDLKGLALEPRVTKATKVIRDHKAAILPASGSRYRLV